MTQRRRGFTLVEILVVIGIMVVLLGLLIPGIAAFRRAAERKSVQADLMTVSQGLEAYKSDFGDYPRPPGDKPTYRVLSWALIGAAEAVSDPWGKLNKDGAEGPGFRTATASKVWGPYVPPEKFQPAGALSQSTYQWDLFDRYGMPIEYFPRWHKPSTQFTSLFGPAPLPPGFPATGVASIYDYRQMSKDDPKTPPKGDEDPSPLNYLRKAMGDLDFSDKIEQANKDGKVETMGETPPFILMSRGPLRKFSLKTDVDKNFSKCREVTNLNIE